MRYVSMAGRPLGRETLAVAVMVVAMFVLMLGLGIAFLLESDLFLYTFLLVSLVMFLFGVLIMRGILFKSLRSRKEIESEYPKYW